MNDTSPYSRNVQVSQLSSSHYLLFNTLTTVSYCTYHIKCDKLVGVGEILLERRREHLAASLRKATSLSVVVAVMENSALVRCTRAHAGEKAPKKEKIRTNNSIGSAFIL